MREKMKITGTSSNIKIEIEGISIVFQGERTVDGFLAYADTVAYYGDHKENGPIEKAERQRIIEQVLEETKDKRFKISFE